MAERPVFISNVLDEELVLEKKVVFNWYPGFAKVQKQKSIVSLHESILRQCNNLKILEISSSSMVELGVKLSAFNLMIKNSNKKDLFSVECLFQSSKKFEKGGPYKELLSKSSIEAKKDDRLKSSGNLICFVYKDEEWSLKPTTHFYDWIYINAVHQNEDLAKELVEFNAFTDIEFNPSKSLNCQARAAALYVSLYRRGIIENIIGNKKNYFNLLQKHEEKQLNIFEK